MKRTQTPAVALAERLCRPQRIGVFGHRGVGKTTLLTMLYREAVGGRLPGLRLAAADARTSGYLSDKVLQLEAGQPLPGTLGETELRFHLYSQNAKLDLLVMDYQGEHVAVGREEPIRDFLRECDAVWLCLDVPAADTADSRLQAEQEVEQLVEDYLTAEPQGALPRPTALVLTKADLLPGADTDAGTLQAVVDRRFYMTRHALQLHCPQHALLAVSSLGGPIGSTPFSPQPFGLDGPLTWLASALREQDEARLKQLFELAPQDHALLGRCVACFARRYPDAPAAREYRQRLREMRSRRLRRRSLAALAAVACLFLGLWGYDAWGARQVHRFEADRGNDPAAVRQRWHSYQAWHPARNWLRPAAAGAEAEHLRDLDRRVREQQCAGRLAELRRRAADPDADAEAVWQQFQSFRTDYPEHDVDGDWRQFRDGLKQKRDRERERRARTAYEEFERREQEADLPTLVEQANRFLRDHAGTAHEPDVRRRRAAYLAHIDERDIESARAYSARNPLNFYTRRERYQQYLERHPEGRFASEARKALDAIAADWDKHDFRAVRDHYEGNPADVKELDALSRRYLAVHPQGRFRSAATELLRWGERVTTAGEYRVILRSGQFDKKVAAYLSRGPSMSVVIEVNGVRYGPSSIVKSSYSPQWNYEFPRRIRWKLGDSVRIHLHDNYYWRRPVTPVGSLDGDPLAMRLLSGRVQGNGFSLTFESDFRMPVMPPIE